MSELPKVDFDFEGGDIEFIAGEPSVDLEEVPAHPNGQVSRSPTAGDQYPASLPRGKAAAASSLPALTGPVVRDRIVILGRRAAGKTVFLARLYEALWQGRDDLSIRALSGQGHRVCMEAIAQLKEGRWPASTLGATYIDLEIKHRGGTELLVMLDYPGEVFRRAFVDNVDAADTRQLIEHVDRASGVILLFDPAVADRGDHEEFIDDEFGMTQAIHRIREWPGGERVPIAVVFTKSDVNKGILRAAGGVRRFCAMKYQPLLRGILTFRLFACAAVLVSPSHAGVSVPDLSRPPLNVVEPLRYCIDAILRNRDDDRRRELDRAAASFLVEKRRAAAEAERRAIRLWTVLAICIVLTLATVGFATARAVGLI